MFRILYLFIFGYVNIEIEGFSIEKFINLCFSNGIFLWKIVRKNSSSILAKISIRDLKDAKKIAKISKCEILKEEKKGIPFILSKYRKRKIFAITFLVIAILIFGLTRFIWNVEVSCDENINKDEIISILEENGIKKGKLIYKINSNEVINKIMLKREDISWIGIKIKGTKVEVNIAQATKKPEIQEKDPCNIISDKNGVISEIIVQSGTARVKKNDNVNKGDLLVEGVMEGKYTGIRNVHAKAKIMAEISYFKEETSKLEQSKFVLTGRTDKKISIKINNFNINFNKTLPKFKNYDKIETYKKVKLFSNFYIPVEIVTKDYKEKKLEYKKYEVDELSKEMQTKLKTEIIKENNIDEKNISQIIPVVTEENNNLTVKLTVIVNEEIGRCEKISF